MTVLVYRALGLGDFLTGVPAYRAVRRAFPGQELVLAAPAPLAPLVPLTAAVDRLLPTSALATPAVGPPGPDVVVNLHGRGPQSHLALLPLDAPRLVAFGCPEAGVTGPEWLPDEHEVARWCRLLVESGVPADADDLTLRPPPLRSPRPWSTLVHPGAAGAARRWPAARYAAVARALADDGHDVVVTAGPGEEALADSVARVAGLGPGSVVTGVDLDDLAALVDEARLLVCADTGVAHLATAYGTPSVVLFGPVPPALWGPPPGRPQHVALWRPADVEGPPAGRPEEPHRALLRLTVDEVVDAAARLDTAWNGPSSRPHTGERPAEVSAGRSTGGVGVPVRPSRGSARRARSAPPGPGRPGAGG